MNRISEITRRNIFDFIQVEGYNYCGRLEETEFLSRIFDLDILPSSDSRYKNASGDIWQHRINNPNDWPDNWVYSDRRFNLLKCDDVIYLQFLCEMIHPLVRINATEVSKILLIFNENLKNDRYEIVEKMRISDKPIFVGRQKISGHDSIKNKNSELTEILNAEYVSLQINLMEAAIETAPYLAIGTAKELIETCCKKILLERNKEINREWDLNQLVKKTNQELQLTPEDIDEQKKASKTIKTILGSLSAVVHGICELRNEYGSGHGKAAKFKGLSPRHAKLAVGAAATLAIFLLETHELRTDANL